MTAASALPAGEPEATTARRFGVGDRGTGGSALRPCRDGLLDVARCGDHRRAALQLPPRVDHTAIEVLEHLPHVGLPTQQIEVVVELPILVAQQDGAGPSPVRFSVSIFRRIHQSGSW